VVDAGALSEPSPFGVTSRKLGIWMFIVADAATFAAMLFAYGFVRVANPDWTRPFTVWPTIVNGIVMTIVLLTSSLTVIAAVLAGQAGRKTAALRWLGATMGLGILFAALHLREWAAMIGEGWRPFRNPLGGPPLVGATFFSITGLHLLHVIDHGIQSFSEAAVLVSAAGHSPGDLDFLDFYDTPERRAEAAAAR